MHRSKSLAALGAALAAITTLAGSAPAQSPTAPRPSELDTRAVAYQDAEGRPSTRFELSGGTPFQSLVLLVGPLRSSAEAAHRASGSFPRTLPSVRPLETRRGWLNADGEASFEVVDRADGRRLYAQFYVPGGLPGDPHGFTHPTALELFQSAGPAPFQRGTILVTEFMKDPSAVSDSQGEWLELFNPTSRRLNLEGMTLSDTGSNSHTIDVGGAGLFLRPGKYAVLGNNDDRLTNGGVPVRYRYSGFTLANSSDSIILTAANGVIMDQVTYDNGVSWPDTPGMSISLDPTAYGAFLNDSPLNWCHSVTPLASGDTGTPRSSNDACP